MQIHTVEDPTYKKKIPPLPFTLILKSIDHWQEFLDTYPEFDDEYHWGSHTGSTLAGLNPPGVHRYFHGGKTVQYSSDLDPSHAHYPQIRWPS